MRTIVCIILIVIFTFLGCQNAPTNPTDSLCVPTSSTSYTTPKTIENGPQYEILELGAWKYAYIIYDMQGNIVLQVETGNAYPEISLLEDNVLGVQVKKGTGVSVHRYYNLSENLLSREYQYVIAYCNGNVAYIEVPQENPLQERYLVIENIEENESPKTYNIDFAMVDSPVIDAHFINNGNALTITYLSGDGQNETTQIIDLT